MFRQLTSTQYIYRIVKSTTHHHHNQGMLTERFPWISLSLSVPFGHHPWEVLSMAYSVRTELMNVNFCWLPKR